MIAYLRGVVLARTAGSLVVDVNGVGYLVGASSSTLDAVGGKGSAVELHVHTVMREDAFALYGFLTTDEKDTFLILNSVQGVGPKAALSLLGTMPGGVLERAIGAGNAKALTAADGVGPKLAARICSEVSSKFVGFEPGGATAGQHAGSSEEDDARSALERLGYNPREAARLVTAAVEAGAGPQIEGLVRHALQNVAR